MRRGFFLKGMLRRGIEMHRSRLLTSSAAVGAISPSGPQHPKGFNVVERKLASGNLKAETKEELYPEPITLSKGVVITSIPQPVPDDEIQCAWIAEPSARAEVLNTPGYPARVPKPRRLDLHEVKPTPDMGLGVFAKRDLKRGDLIFAERPLVVTPFAFPVEELSAIPNDYYTDLQKQKTLRLEFESLLEATIALLPSDSQADFKDLHNAYPGDCHLVGIAFTNGFGITLNNGSDETPLSGAVCKLASRINHSCMPNAQFKFKSVSFSVQIYALRDIKTGDQLFVSYCAPDRNFAERRAQLKGFGIVCKCPACINATPKADQLRKTFATEIGRVGMALQDSSKTDPPLLEIALMLENDLVKEGLDAQVEFGLLLMVICLEYAKLGKVKEREMYRARVKEFSNWEE